MSIPLDPFETALRPHGLVGARRVVVGVSGGADSTALLYALVRRRAADASWPEPIVAHLDHGLRGEASRADAEFVAGIARSLALEAVVESVDVSGEAARRGGNLEAVARDVRYAFLARAATAVGADRVATAHTASDQAETVLMRLARGAGPDGLAGILAERPLEDGVTLVRPLLGLTREDVLDYCRRREIAFRTDATNADERLARVRARVDVLPSLERLAPGAAANLARAAEIAAADRAYFAERVAHLFAEWGVADHGEIALPAADVAALPAAIRRRVLREAVRRTRGDLRRIGFEHIDALERLLEPGRGGREAVLPLGVRARRDGPLLVVGNTVESRP